MGRRMGRMGMMGRRMGADGDDGAADAPATPESNSPVTSGDHGLDALEPNDEAEEKAADPA